MDLRKCQICGIGYRRKYILIISEHEMKHPKRYFNMVEIVLAIAVAAIGIVGIVGVLPVAVKSNTNAEADSIVSDAAATFFAEVVDERVMRTRRSGASLSTIPSSKGSDPSKRSISQAKSSTTKLGGIDFGDTLNDVDNNTNAPFMMRNWRIEPNVDENPLFEADIRFWYEYPDDIVAFKTENKAGQIYVIPEVLKNYTKLIRVYAEISWPVNVEYKNREKRIFVKEYFMP